MRFLNLVEMIVLTAAAVIYIAKSWAAAKHTRDSDFATRPFGGIVDGERKPSAVPYLFR